MSLESMTDDELIAEAESILGDPNRADAHFDFLCESLVRLGRANAEIKTLRQRINEIVEKYS